MMVHIPGLSSSSLSRVFFQDHVLLSFAITFAALSFADHAISFIFSNTFWIFESALFICVSTSVISLSISFQLRHEDMPASHKCPLFSKNSIILFASFG